MSRLNCVQKETMWSLVLYVVRMYVVCRMWYFAKLITVSTYIDVFLWDLDTMILGVESHMWPQQTWGQRSSRGQWILVQVFEKRVTVSTFFHVFSWDLDTTMIPGQSHTCDPNSLGVKGHLGVNDLWFKVFFFLKGHCIHILWCIFMGLGYNDPWVESHMWPMWPQQKWGHRPSWGHWPFVLFFWKY